MNSKSKYVLSGISILGAIILLLLFIPFRQTKETVVTNGVDKKWYPFEVDIWNPPFNDKYKHYRGEYVALEKASKPWKICVSIPHLKDPYWRVVNYSLIDEAQRLGIRMHLVEAGGYENIETQRNQIEQIMSTGADALIISSITTDGLNDLIDKYMSKGKPVIDMINGVTADVTAKAICDYYYNGLSTAHYLKNLHTKSPARIKVAWFPGPKGPGWVEQGDKGFRDGVKGSVIDIVYTKQGDTGRDIQKLLIEEVLDETTDIDYIVGTTVTADAAVEVLRRRQLNGKIKVMAYYYGPGVDRGIRRGTVISAPTDLQGIQARIAVDIAVRALENKRYYKHVGPKIIMIDQSNVEEVNPIYSLPPRGFRPIFSEKDWIN